MPRNLIADEVKRLKRDHAPCERCGGPITLVRVCEACVSSASERGTGEKP